MKKQWGQKSVSAAVIYGLIHYNLWLIVELKLNIDTQGSSSPEKQPSGRKIFGNGFPHH